MTRRSMTKAPVSWRAGLAWTLALVALAGCGGDPARPGTIDPGDWQGGPADAGSAPADTLQDAESGDAQGTPQDTGGPKVDVPGAACPGGEGCPCTAHGECDNGYCLQTPDGEVCATSCVDQCAAGMACTLVNGAGGDSSSICVPAMGFACAPCDASKACEAAGHAGGRCVRYGAAGSFCGVSCATSGECATGYVCQGVTTIEGKPTKQCVRAPETGSAAPFGVCPCSKRAAAKLLSTACSVPHVLPGGGEVSCHGVRSCKAPGEAGLGPCDAPAPSAEKCDGTDDDCDGATDEGTCDDGEPCTKDTCGAAGCAHEPADGAPCDDGNPCTAGDACKNGQCLPDAKICVCEKHADCGPLEDGNLCNGTLRCNTKALPYKCEVDPGTVVACDKSKDTPCLAAACDPKTGTCVMQPAVDGAPCDDGDACTVGDACKAGKCAPGASICACQKDADCAPQEDGDLCNGTLLCDKTALPYKCAVDPKTVVKCATDLDSTCAKAACQPKTGQCALAPVADGTPCNDGDQCTAGDTCAKGKCAGGAMVCACKKDADCAKYDDGDVCNGKLACDTSKLPYKCAVDPKTVISCDPGKDTACAKNTCDAKTGACAVKATTDGAPCNDGDPCTLGDGCAGGQCKGGAGICACKKDADCAASEDGDLCNGTLRCDTSKLPYKCVLDPKTVVKCDSSGDTTCVANTCAPKTGKCAMVSTQQGKACDDGDACTAADQCKAGKCAGAKLDCDDKNPCTDDACGLTGCTHAPNAAACSDGDACTLGDKCAGGKCVSGPAPSCGDKLVNGSESDVDCGGVKGVCGLPKCAACAAGKKCGVGGDCASGVCAGGKCQAPSCSDGVKNGGEIGVDCGGGCAMCPRLFALVGGPTVSAAVMAKGAAWKTHAMGGTTVDGVALAAVGGQQVVGAMRYTKLNDPKDNTVRCAVWSDGKWGPFTGLGPGITTRARPALTSLNNKAFIAFAGKNYKYYFATWSGGKWSGVGPIGAPQAFGPAAPELAVIGGKVSAVYIDGKANNQVAVRTLAGTSWGGPAHLGGQTRFDLRPALVALGGDALAAWVRQDGQVMVALQVQGKWQGASTVPDAWTGRAVAAAALGGGGALLAFRGTDAKVYAARRSKGAWAKPVAVGLIGPAAPAVSRGIGGLLAELLWVDGQGQVLHARLKGSGWSSPATLGLSGARVALIAAP